MGSKKKYNWGIYRDIDKLKDNQIPVGYLLILSNRAFSNELKCSYSIVKKKFSNRITEKNAEKKKLFIRHVNHENSEVKYCYP
jgi:hypothetical protein